MAVAAQSFDVEPVFDVELLGIQKQPSPPPAPADVAEPPQDAEVTRLIEAAMQSPTSFNIQHWRFVVVRDPELRKQIRAVGNDQAQMTDASLLVLFTADKDAWKKSPERYWENAPEEVADLLVNWMGPFHEGREWLQRDEAER